MRWLRRITCGIPEEQVARFCRGRAEQGDDDFLRELGRDDPEDRRVALAVRRAVASVESVPAAFVRASDAYPDQLAVLPVWDSIDWLAFVAELETELGVRFEEGELQAMFLGSRVTVAQLAVSVRLALETRAR